MRPKDFIGLAFIITSIAIFYTLGSGLNTPTGYFAIEENWTECTINDDACLLASLTDCSPTHFVSDFIMIQDIYVYTHNITHCMMHSEVTSEFFTDNETLTADCTVPQGNYTMEEFDAYMEEDKFKVCNGSLIDFERWSAGYRDLHTEIGNPITGENYVLGDDIELNATIQYNLSYDKGEPIFEYLIAGTTVWNKASIITIYDLEINGVRAILGLWETDNINLTSDTDVTLRLRVNFTDNRSDVVWKEDTVTVLMNYSISIPPPGGDKYEPDNSFTDTGNDAKEIIPGGSPQNRSFHTESDVDYLYFDGQKDRMFTIKTDIGGSAVDTKISLYDSSQVFIGSDDDNGDSGNESMIVHSLTAAERIYLKVENIGDLGKYNISVTQLADGDGDGFTPGIGPGSDCDDTDALIHPIRGGMVLSASVKICPYTYSDINSPITVSGDDIVIDCDLNPISGTLYSSLFIINDSTDITLKNCELSNFTRAIVMDGCISCKVINTTIIDNTLGIHAMDSIVTIEESVISQNDHSGIIFEETSGSILSTELQNNGLDGMTLINSSGIIMDDVSITHNTRNGISSLNSEDVKIQHSTISYNQKAGIMANQTVSLTIKNSSVSQNDDGVLLSDSQSTNITWITFSSNTLTDISLSDDSPETVLRFNSFLTQSNTAVKNTQGPSVDAKMNYWNTDSESAIRERITDYYDDAHDGKVIYSPWLDSPTNLTEFSYGKNYTECDDGVDNDFDGLIDFGKDPECPNSSWNNESIAPFDPIINDTNSTDNTTNTSVNASCEGDWICTDWSECQLDSLRVRTCFNNNNCSIDPPLEVEECINEAVLLCSNGIRDLGEDMTDCGGTCPECDKPADTEEPASTSGGIWIYIIIIIVVLALAGGGFFGYQWYTEEQHHKESIARYQKEVQLNNYVKDELTAGFKPDLIQKKMSDAGWDPAQVSQSLVRNNGLGELRPFIKGYLTKGFSDEVIIEKLVNSGWDRTLVTNTLNKLDRPRVSATIPSHTLNKAWTRHYSSWNRQIQSSFSGSAPQSPYQVGVSSFPKPQTQYKKSAYQKKKTRLNRPVKKSKYQLSMVDGKWVIKAE